MAFNGIRFLLHNNSHSGLFPTLKTSFQQRRIFSQLGFRPRKNVFKYTPALARQAVRRLTVATMADGVSSRGQKIVGRWLAGCAGMCFGAIVLGGVTRLTESGLSMVEWNLIKDMRPPRSQQEWEEEFEKYRSFPEYHHILSSGREMTLSDFKFIFYMEYVHRLWGRATGTAFFLPAAFFLYKGWISKHLKPRLLLYSALIGYQGFMGWYMVKSGLQEKDGPNDVPRVSQYRLAAHLTGAVILYTLFLWSAMSHLRPGYLNWPKVANIAKYNTGIHTVATFIFGTTISGAFVAGLDAGRTYNTWPKMADRWIPSDILAYSPTWTNFFDNPTTVQFDHRILGKLTVASAAAFWWTCRKAPLPPVAKLAANCLLGMALIQMTLGISTLLTEVSTPVAATHQAGAITFLSIAVWLMHILRRIPK